jgi:hypothetical protein
MQKQIHIKLERINKMNLTEVFTNMSLDIDVETWNRLTRRFNQLTKKDADEQYSNY